MKFNNKYALVTGGAGLLGPYHAEALAEDGYNIILVDISIKRLNNVRIRLKKKFNKIDIKIYQCDITNTNNVSILLKKLIKEKIFVSCLVNNAEKNPQMKETKIRKKLNRIEDYDHVKLLREIEVGIFGTFNCCKVFGSVMAKKNHGIIINISSDLGITAPDQRVYASNEKISSVKNFKPIGYSISKHAISGITKYFSTYWAHKNVRCNTLALGAVLNNQPKFLVNNVKKKIPLNRWAKKDEYKTAIQFLASQKNTYMTGQTVIVDGGRTIW
jgi:NAD(P)-dependent dehydrogenase (short-subunit alcohol dehydrogenase family)